MQNTLQKKVYAEGNGIHYNKFAHLTLNPAPENSGIIFKRVDLAQNNEIVAIYNNIENTQLSTKIFNGKGASVSTIEHLMAALSSFAITNLVVEIDNIEVPILEGGSEDFCFLIESAGILQNAPLKQFKLLREVKVENDHGSIVASPSDVPLVHFTSNFSSAVIGEQKISFDFSKMNFLKEISSAKTIANLNEVEYLQKHGLGLGGNLKNTLVFDKDKVLNEKHLFHISDFVRHKVLDFIGDISLAGGRLIANFNCYKSGHTLNHNLLEEIFSHEENYKLI